MRANIQAVRRNRGWRISLFLLTAIVGLTVVAASHAQTLIGSTGAGWQTWNLAQDINSNFIDLNSNGAPYWDVPFLTFNAGGMGANPLRRVLDGALPRTATARESGARCSLRGHSRFGGCPITRQPTQAARSTLQCISGQADLDNRTRQRCISIQLPTRVKSTNLGGLRRTLPAP